jgi:hypothetical protein
VGVGHQDARARAEELVEVAQAVERPVEDRDLGLQPEAMRAAWSPTTPPPMTTVRARATPATPPMSSPGPPFGACRNVADAMAARRPAISLIGSSSGRRWSGVSTVS